jgi:hypothetical protein
MLIGMSFLCLIFAFSFGAFTLGDSVLEKATKKLEICKVNNSQETFFIGLDSSYKTEGDFVKYTICCFESLSVSDYVYSVNFLAPDSYVNAYKLSILPDATPSSTYNYRF